MPFVSFLPDDAGMRDIIMSRPEQMGPLNQMARILMRGPSSFTEGERELIGAFVSSTNDCPFCVGTHAAAASHFDVPESTLQALALEIGRASCRERV
jgi:AhpD family alkylhydroperoxidase